MSEGEGGQCGCCAGQGTGARGLRGECADLLRDCFNLEIPTDTSDLICETCVVSLRAACAFKQLILETWSGVEGMKWERESECEYYDFVSKTPDGIGEDDLKVLKIKKEPMSQWSSDDDDVLLSMADRIAANEASKKYKSKKIKGCRVKKVNKLSKTSSIKVRSKVGNSVTKTSRNIQEGSLSKKNMYIANSFAILTSSNATPFKGKNTRGFRCFYCPRNFEEPQSLRQHAAQDHLDEKHLRLLSKFSADDLVIYLDITDLSCRLCSEEMVDLDALKMHLTTIHDKKIYKDIEERDIPFKLSQGSIQCQKCPQTFETFGSLERHMNIHYRYYICTLCEAGFMSNKRLSAHKKLHDTGIFTCFCGKTFGNQMKLTLHTNAVHKLKARFRCAHCQERFTDYYKRQSHLESIHNAKPLEYKCNVCERSFTKKNSLNIHTKKYHLQERNHMCNLCNYKCFTNHELQSHMIRHNGQRVHECAVCKKAYARKKTLKEHMRIHNNDRRFSCTFCGQSFVQNCSLKSHVKTHHPEILQFTDR